MPASITGSGPNGTFLVTDGATGVTAPATLDQLQPYPDLYGQAVSLSVPQSGALNPIDSAAAGLASLGRKAYSAADSALERARPAIKGALADSTAAPPPPAAQAVEPAPVPPPPPAGGPPVEPATAPPAAPPIAPHGTGGPAVPRAPAGPDQLDAGYRAQLEAEKAKEGAENRVYDANEVRRQAEAKAFAEKQAQLQAAQDAAFKQQVQLQNEAAKAHNLDPNKWWTDKSTLGQIFFQISNLMNGAAVGAAGRPGDAGAFIDNAIKQNLEIQQHRAEGLDKAAEAKGNLVQHFRQAGLDNKSAYEAAQATMKENLATDLLHAAVKPGMDGIAPALKVMAAKLQVDSVKEHTQLAKDRASTVLDLSNATKARAETAKIGVETSKLSQATNADNIAKQLAAAGQPLPPQLLPYLSPELQKSVSGDRYLVIGEGAPAKSNEEMAKFKTHDATLERMQDLLKTKNVDADALSQAAQDALASAKDYYGLKRGGGEDDQGLTSMAPGLREALGADIKWASPGARERALRAVINQRNNIARRASGALTAQGHPGIKGSNIDFQKGLQ